MHIGVVNARARQRYAEFVGAMDLVLECLTEVKKLVDRVDDDRAPEGGWTLLTRDELAALWRKAFDELDGLRRKTKRYEAELISRDWRL